MRLRVYQLRPLVGQRHFGPLNIHCANQTSFQPFLLVLEFFLQHLHGILAHLNLRAIKEEFVERDSNIHRHAISNFLEFVNLFLDVQPRDCHLAGHRTARVKVLLDPQYGIVIFVPKSRFGLLLPPVVKSSRGDGREKSRTRFNEAPACCLNFLARDCDVRILRLGQGDCFFDSVSRHPMCRSGQGNSDQQNKGAKLQTHFVYLLARAFFSTKRPVAFILISVLASGRDIRQIRRLQQSEPLRARITHLNRSGLICISLRIDAMQIAFQP